MADQINIAPLRALDSNGLPVPSALATFYLSGTSTLQTVYADAAGTVPHPQPLVADIAGIFPQIFSNVNLKVTVATPLGAVLPGYPIDPAYKTAIGGTGASAITFSPTADVPVSTVQAAIERVQTNLNSSVLPESGTGAILRQTAPVLIRPYSYSPAVYVEAAIAAGTNAQGQGPFDGDITVITTAAAAPSGATLPIARLGRTITVINRGANPVNIYPAVGAAIVGKATNAPHLLAVAGRAVFSASSVTEWHVFSPATEAEAVALVNNTGFLTPYLMRLALNATGDAPTFATRAWATFNGTGTLAALSSGGVASITDLGGVGRYRVTLSHPAPHANYAVGASCSKTNTATESTGVTVEIFNRTTTTFDIATTDPTSNTNDDAAYVAITVVY